MFRSFTVLHKLFTVVFAFSIKSLNGLEYLLMYISVCWI